MFFPLFFRSGRIRQEHDRETNEVSIIALARFALHALIIVYKRGDSIIEARLHPCALFVP